MCGVKQAAEAIKPYLVLDEDMSVLSQGQKNLLTLSNLLERSAAMQAQLVAGQPVSAQDLDFASLAITPEVLPLLAAKVPSAVAELQVPAEEKEKLSADIQQGLQSLVSFNQEHAEHLLLEAAQNLAPIATGRGV